MSVRVVTQKISIEAVSGDLPLGEIIKRMEAAEIYAVKATITDLDGNKPTENKE